MRVLISTGEVSGDVVGAHLVRAIRERRGDAEVLAIGGPRMERAGADLRFRSSHLGTVGLTEAFRTLPDFARAWATVRRLVRDHRPHVTVLIGNDLFHVLLGRWLRSKGVPTVSYFPPQIWIWRSLAGQIVRSFDAVLASFPEEEAVYRRASRGAHVTFVGHYLSDVLLPRTPRDVQAARRRLSVPDGVRVIGLMPGSRSHEVAALAPTLAGAARLLLERDATIQFVLPVAEERYRTCIERSLAAAGVAGDVTLVPGPDYDAMTAADLLLMSSGTATLEATLLGVPMVIVYRVSALTYTVVRAGLACGLIESKTVGLPNLILGRKAIPELVQGDATPEAIACEAWTILSSPARMRQLGAALAEAAGFVSGGDTLDRVARSVIGWAAAVHDLQPVQTPSVDILTRASRADRPVAGTE